MPAKIDTFITATASTRAEAPLDGRPADTSTRHRIVEAAARLLLSRGYADASLRDIVEEAGAPWGSLHHYFPRGKQQIAAEAVALGQAQVADLIDQSFACTNTPEAAMRRFFDVSRDLLAQTDYQFGCPIATIALERTDSGDELAAGAGAAFEDWLARFAAGFRAGGIDVRRARRLATAVLSQFEGALLLSRLTRNLEPIRTAKTISESLVVEARKPSLR